MPTDRQTGTNAADSAPGVDDGAVRRDAGSSRTAQPNKAVVWVLVALSLLALLAIFILRPMNRDQGTAIGVGQTSQEIQSSTVPGADSRNPAAQGR